MVQGHDGRSREGQNNDQKRAEETDIQAVITTRKQVY